MMIARLLTLGIAFAVLGIAGPTVHLDPIVSISSLGSGNYMQVWAHADPENSNYLIVCGPVHVPSKNLLAGYVYSSADGGENWRRTLLGAPSKFTSEEQCAFGSHANAYFIEGASDYYNGDAHHELGHMHFFASHDHGLTWLPTWIRQDGWLDWTSLATSVNARGMDDVVVFANNGTDKLGHMFPLRPVAIESHDDGRSFSNLVAPHPLGFRYVAAWTGQTVTLPDGTMLFATSASRGQVASSRSTGWASGNIAVEIFAYSPLHHTLRSRAVLRMRRSLPVFTVSLAQDHSGRFNGRLYSAWVEANTAASALWFGYSDDGGYHWKSRPLLHSRGTDTVTNCAVEQPIDRVDIATAPDGTLGVSWSANNAVVLFAASHDGGMRFTSPTTIDAVQSETLSSFEVVPWNDYWLYAMLTMERETGHPQYAWMNTLGLGLVVTPGGVDDLRLTADRAGRFHVFWIAPRSTEPSLMTRTVVVEGSDVGTPTFSGEKGSGACAMQRASVLARPALPRPIPMVAFSGSRDVTSSIALSPVSYNYNSVARTASIDVEIVNKSKTMLHAPLTIVGINPHSDFGTAYVTNASGSISGQPYWDVSAIIPARGLTSGIHSRPLHIAVAISHFHSLPSPYLQGEAFSVAIRAYERTSR